MIPRSAPVVKKLHFSCVLPSRELSKTFRRLAFYLISAKESQVSAVLIHYIGDESVAEEFPHGNSKHSPVNHYRTCPSVLNKMSTVADLPSNVYKKTISSNRCPPELQASCMPHNKRQVINLQQKERQKSRLSHDALYNLHEIAYDLDNFVKIITTFPNLVVICGLNNLLAELDMVLQLDSNQYQLLSYDTTFELGDFYLSPLLYRHTLFKSCPAIPALFLIHERKFQRDHETFMEYLSTLVPTLGKGKKRVPLVTDEEAGINAVSKLLFSLFISSFFHNIFVGNREASAQYYQVKMLESYN